MVILCSVFAETPTSTARNSSCDLLHLSVPRQAILCLPHTNPERAIEPRLAWFYCVDHLVDELVFPHGEAKMFLRHLTPQESGSSLELDEILEVSGAQEL